MRLVRVAGVRRVRVGGWWVAILLLGAACSDGSAQRPTGSAGAPGGTGSGATAGALPVSAGTGALAGSSLTGGAPATAAGAAAVSGGRDGGASAGSASAASGADTGGTASGAAGSNAAPAGAGGALPVGGGRGGSSSMPLGALTVSDLKVEANPKMSLGCTVSWTTSEAASSEVQFGVDAYELHVVDAASVTAHRVYVLGMHSDSTYKIKALSSNATATGSAESTFTTGKLPANAPAQGTLVAQAFDKMQPGWTLTNYFVGSGNAPGIVLILDEQAIPVWYYVHGTTADQFGMTSTVFLPNQHVLVGNASAEPAQELDLEGNVVWTGPTGGTPAASHHTSKLATGNYLIVRESNASARVEELNPQNQVVWHWDLYDYLKPKTTAADWCHLNSVSVDEAKDILYFNCRFQGLFGVKRSTGDILFQMGAAIDDSNSGDVKYLPDNSARFNDSHDPEIHADGTVLFYDNQGWANHTGGEGNGSYHTRVVEYALDQAKKEATLTWEFPGKFAVDAWYKNDWATPIWGDADRLENGNVLVTAGVKSSTTKTRIFEVTNDGVVVWGFEWPAANNGSYRADRIPALATKLE